MKYLLDTDICIFVIRKKPESVFSELRRQSVGEVGISSITYSELCHGVWKSRQPEKNRLALQSFVTPLQILAYDESIGDTYGRIRRQLEKSGQPIGPLDMLIAAHAMSRNLRLVTNNTAEFERVEGLRVENWL